MNRRRVGVAAAATIAVAALLLYQKSRSDDPWEELTHAVGDGGAVHVSGRLSLIAVDTRAAAASAARRGVARGSTSHEMRIRTAASRVLESSLPEQQKASAVLLAGDVAKAVADLHLLASNAGASAAVWSDYAAALIAAAEQGDHTRYLDALAAADHALDRDPSSVPARFNRAVVLDRLHLRDAAAAAYREYLLVDGASSYAFEARHRIRELGQTSASPARWEELLPALERAAANDDTRPIEDAALQYRQQARTYGESEILGLWGQAISAGDTRRAATLLSLARTFGRTLETAGDEAMLADAVATIDAAGSDDQRLNVLAAAHAAYRQGRVFYKDRDVARAAESFRRAGRWFDQAASPMALLVTYFRASAAVDAGDRRLAVALLNEVDTRASTRYRALRAQIRWLRGTIFGFDGLLSDALGSYQRAAAEFTDLREYDHAMQMQYRIASVLTILGRPAEARRMHVALIPAASDAGDTRTLEATLYAVATDALREKRWDVGQSFLTLVVAIEGGNPRLHAEAMVWRALAAGRARMRRSAAASVADARQALALLIDPGLRADVENDLRLVEALLLAGEQPRSSIALLTEYLEAAAARGQSLRTAEVLVERARLLRAERRMAEAEADLRQAIETVEARGRNLAADVLRDSFIGKSGSAYELLSDLLDGRNAVEEAVTVGDRRRARVVLDRIRNDRDQARTLSGSRVAALLPPRTALIAYGAFGDRLVLFVHTAAGLQRFSLPVPSQRVEAAARSFTAAVEGSNRTLVASEGRALYRILIEPMASALAGVDSLVFVADAPLDTVPFAALVQPDGRYLIQNFAVTMAPSVQAWSSRREQSTGRTARTLLTVGNPLLDTLRYASLAPLLHAEAEARRIAALYPQALVLVGPDATHARVTDALRRSDVAHFAAHAVADPFDAGRSRLLLTAAPQQTDALTAEEISRMDLRGMELAVLAGCETSVTANTHGYIRSLAAAFIAAGARNVIASLWDIDDAVTRPLSVSLHQELRNGSSPAAALRRAQLQMLASGDPSLTDVRAWSAMVIYGSGD